jgi:hypothetical protein
MVETEDTKALVDELKERDGVYVTTIGPDDSVSMDIKGPATILTVID